MTAVLDAPAAVAAAPWRRAVLAGRRAPLLATLLVLTGLVGSVVLWAPAAVSLTAGTTTFDGEADVVTVPGYGARGTHVVDYRHGAQVEVVVPLRNDGALPVRVVSVSTGEGRLPLLGLAAVGGPVTLAAGATHDLLLRGTLQNCAYYHERAAQSVDGLAVELAVLGRPARRTVLLDRPLLVHSPMIVGCPDRTLTRNDDRRTPGGSRL